MNDQDVKVRVRPSVTLSDNYLRLTNKPKINGIELVGEMTTTELNIMSNDMAEYQEISLGAALTSGSFFLAISEQNEVGKIRLDKLTEGRFSTTDDISDVQVGNYIFKERER